MVSPVVKHCYKVFNGLSRHDSRVHMLSRFINSVKEPVNSLDKMCFGLPYNNVSFSSLVMKVFTLIN